MQYTQFEACPATGALGAEIRGLDLSQPMADQTFSELRSAWLEYQVLFFRDQQLTPEQHVAFGRRFGDIDPSAFIPTLDEHPDVRVQDMADYSKLGTDINWHSDNSFREYPQKCSALYALQVPSKGGDTAWANMYLAYDQLSPAMRELPRWPDRYSRPGRNHGPGNPEAIRARPLEVIS